MAGPVDPLALEEIGTFVALGHTYPAHRQYDTGPEWPICWTVPAASIVPEEEPIRIPDYVDGVVPGAELAVVIGESLWQASEAEARAAIAGFTVSNDVYVTGRFPGYPYGDAQAHPMGRGYHILPTFSPTLSSVVDLEPEAAGKLAVEIRVDGEEIFSGSTSEMDWSVPELVRHASFVVELSPGDVVSLGDGSTPERSLDDADHVECWIEGIGVLRNPITVTHAETGPCAPDR